MKARPLVLHPRFMGIGQLDQGVDMRTRLVTNSPTLATILISELTPSSSSVPTRWQSLQGGDSGVAGP